MFLLRELSHHVLQMKPPKRKRRKRGKRRGALIPTIKISSRSLVYSFYGSPIMCFK